MFPAFPLGHLKLSNVQEISTTPTGVIQLSQLASKISSLTAKRVLIKTPKDTMPVMKDRLVLNWSCRWDLKWYRFVVVTCPDTTSCNN